MKKIQFYLFALFAIAIGLYPSLYFMLDRRFGLLQGKSEELLSDWFWNFGFYTHIIFGGLALLAGWSQFSKNTRAKQLNLHRYLGKIYVFCVMLSSVAGIYIGFYASEGWIAKTGFICLGIIWFSTTLTAYRYILRKDIAHHEKMMTYSYGACFAAVTLRIWLPILIATFGDFTPAYRLVAWLCWVPNILVAHYFVVRLNQKSRHEVADM